MSKSGRCYLREQERIRRDLWKQSPAFRFVRSLDFCGKFAAGAFVIGLFLWNFPPAMSNPLLLTLAIMSLLLFPFAKRGSDDVILHLTSEKCFEVVNGGGATGLGALYLMLIVPLSIPLGLAYGIYHYYRYRATVRIP